MASLISRVDRLMLAWVAVGLLAVLCASLAYMQSRWIRQISVAERDRLHAELEAQLNRLSPEFDLRIARSYAALTPSFDDVSLRGSAAACSRQYQQWKVTSEPMFRRIALVQYQDGQFVFTLLNLESGQFEKSEWPGDWAGMRARFQARLNDAPLPALPSAESALLDFSLFGSLHARPVEAEESRGTPRTPMEDWLLAEIDPQYLRSTVLPELFAKFIGISPALSYEAEVVDNNGPAEKVIDWQMEGRKTIEEPDASVSLLDVNHWDSPSESGSRRGSEGVTPNHGPRYVASDRAPARWRLLVRHRGNSWERIVAGAQWRNILLSGGILSLIVVTMTVLLRFSRQSEQLAQMQISFVAGVSHELRTPLTVIRTLAFNLRGKVATRPDQVERYGQMIQKESEKLSILVDQVLRYGGATAGRVIGERRAVAVEPLIEKSVQSSSVGSLGSDLVLESHTAPGLPMILADELAMRHVLQNLLDNAVKYGLEGSDWIGIFAEAITEEEQQLVEIRVEDRGPGVPPEEQKQIFDAFFRGRNALHDQIHGTGLGLNLARRIIEAHGGSIRVKSDPFNSTRFIIRIPVAPEESIDAFANPAD